MSLTDKAFDSLESALSGGTKYFLAYREHGKVVPVDSGGVPELHATLEDIIPSFAKYKAKHPELDVRIYMINVSEVKQPVITTTTQPQLLNK